jgi:lipoprotein-releasing system ATP-binding protein
MVNMVHIEALVKNYKSRVETLNILDALSMDIEAGSSVSIMGASGCGKSTLLNILGGLDRFDSGVVTVGGKSIGGLSENKLSVYRRNSVGFIFQFHYLLKDFTALENVMLPAYVAGETKKNAIERARVLLDEVQLRDRILHYPAKLSGGERQRVAVARALINDPEIILADEPTGNLDKKHSELIADLLYGSAQAHNKTLIVVTHDEEIACRAKTKYKLDYGKLSEWN